jgi:hypothetical protein
MSDAREWPPSDLDELFIHARDLTQDLFGGHCWAEEMSLSDDDEALLPDFNFERGAGGPGAIYVSEAWSERVDAFLAGNEAPDHPDLDRLTAVRSDLRQLLVAFAHATGPEDSITMRRDWRATWLMGSEWPRVVAEGVSGLAGDAYLDRFLGGLAVYSKLEPLVRWWATDGGESPAVGAMRAIVNGVAALLEVEPEDVLCTMVRSGGGARPLTEIVAALVSKHGLDRHGKQAARAATDQLLKTLTAPLDNLAADRFDSRGRQKSESWGTHVGQRAVRELKRCLDRQLAAAPAAGSHRGLE